MIIDKGITMFKSTKDRDAGIELLIEVGIDARPETWFSVPCIIEIPIGECSQKMPVIAVIQNEEELFEVLESKSSL